MLDEQFETGSDGTSLSKSTSKRSDDDETESGFEDRMLDEQFKTGSNGTRMLKSTSKRSADDETETGFEVVRLK